jgi:hypothetical protein
VDDLFINQVYSPATSHRTKNGNRNMPTDSHVCLTLVCNMLFVVNKQSKKGRMHRDQHCMSDYHPCKTFWETKWCTHFAHNQLIASRLFNGHVAYQLDGGSVTSWKALCMFLQSWTGYGNTIQTQGQVSSHMMMPVTCCGTSSHRI